MEMPYIPETRSAQAQRGPELTSDNIELAIRQQPQQALVTLNKKEKNRKPIDPPPIVQLRVTDSSVDSSWMVSPYIFLIAVPMKGDSGEELLVGDKYIIGTTSSSLHRLKDIDNKDGGFFVFGDISLRQPGVYRLRFHLFNQNKTTSQVEYLGNVDSQPFHVLTNKEFTGLKESSHLSRTFSDQGVRLRLRKEQKTKKRRYDEPDASPSNGNHYAPAVGGGMYAPYKRHRADSDYQDPNFMYGQMNGNGYGHNGSMSMMNGGYPGYTSYSPANGSDHSGNSMPYSSNAGMSNPYTPHAVTGPEAPSYFQQQQHQQQQQLPSRTLNPEAPGFAPLAAPPHTSPAEYPHMKQDTQGMDAYTTSAYQDSAHPHSQSLYGTQQSGFYAPAPPATSYTPLASLPELPNQHSHHDTFGSYNYVPTLGSLGGAT